MVGYQVIAWQIDDLIITATTLKTPVPYSTCSRWRLWPNPEFTGADIESLVATGPKEERQAMNDILTYFTQLAPHLQAVVLRFLLVSHYDHSARDRRGRVVSTKVLEERLAYLAAEPSTLEYRSQLLRDLAKKLERSHSALNTDFKTVLPTIFLGKKAKDLGLFTWDQTGIALDRLKAPSVDLFWDTSGGPRYWTAFSKHAGLLTIEAYSADSVGTGMAELVAIIEAKYPLPREETS